MSNTDTFYTYTGSYINGLGRATVIITVDKDAKPYAYSEYFAFLENNDAPIYYEENLHCIKEVDKDNIANIDLTIVKDSVFKGLEKRLKEKYKIPLLEYSFSKLIDLSKEIDNNAILGLIMRNKFSEKIAQVMKKTKSEKLRSFLEQHSNLVRKP